MRRLAPSVLLAALLACAESRELEPSGKGECTTCHGGGDNTTGAPPLDVRGRSGTTLVTVGAHTLHVERLGLGCGECHPDARASGRHPDGRTQVTFGPLARRGGAAPAYAAGTCSGVYCHGAFPNGNGAAGVAWNGGAAAAACGTCHGVPGAALPSLPAAHPPLAAGATQVTCHRCHPDSVDSAGALVPARHADGVLDVLPAAAHPAGWAAPSSHGAAAAGDVRACTACHAAKGPAVLTTVVCAGCHDAIAGGDWTVTCGTCHGSAASPAPPPDTSGDTATTARGVGAHQAHLAAGALGPAFGCSHCHRVPADVLAEGHLDGAVTVTGYTGADPVWTAALPSQALGEPGPTCTTYCHGGLRNGNASNAPTWTSVGTGEAACGTCHALPPTAPHPATQGGLAGCNACHGETMDRAGALVPSAAGGKHLSGVIEANGHDAAWMETASPGFHAFAANAGLAACRTCHGDDLAGGAAAPVGCGDCHGAGWATSCTMCHGGPGSTSGAPPEATWGHRATSEASNVRVGAHARHQGTSAIAPAFACTDCHPARTSAFDAGHLDGGTADVAFGAKATHGGDLAPAWDRAAATCASTYCHGGSLTGGAVPAPVWTAGPGAGACGACHGSPPLAPHPPVPAGLPGCAECHPGTVTAAGAVIPPATGGQHLDGTVQGGHGTGWYDPASPAFHAFDANRGLAGCAGCHGPTLDGVGKAGSCAQCHGAGWKTNCTMCHGGTDNALGAPPDATWAHRAPADRTNVRVGAHTVHVEGTPSSPAFACTVCHPSRTSALEEGHVDGEPAAVAFTGIAGGGSWDRTAATCASTYCHSGIQDRFTEAPVWTDEDLGPGCMSCHLAPPQDSGHAVHLIRAVPCAGCHPGSSSAQANPALHVNGTKDVRLADGCVVTTAFARCDTCHPY